MSGREHVVAGGPGPTVRYGEEFDLVRFMVGRSRDDCGPLDADPTLLRCAALALTFPDGQTCLPSQSRYGGHFVSCVAFTRAGHDKTNASRVRDGGAALFVPQDVCLLTQVWARFQPIA